MNTDTSYAALSKIIEQFYILSGIKIALYDENHNRIVSHPYDDDEKLFCSFMRKNETFKKKCVECDKNSFNKCRKTGALVLYTCHAGLIEATAPIITDGKILGYAMFGQITDIKNKELFTEKLTDICRNYLVPDEELILKIKAIEYRTEKQILAAAQILDALTNYILLKDLMISPKQRLLEKLEEFIDRHIDERIPVGRICDEFYISKTQLYELVGKELKCGIASFIKNKRFLRAKTLLKETDMSIRDISALVGFEDYNYFIRSFREEFGITPNRYRKDKMV